MSDDKIRWLIEKSDNGVIVVTATTARQACEIAERYCDDCSVLRLEPYYGRTHGINE